MTVDGVCEMDVIHEINEENNTWGALKVNYTNRGFLINAKKVYMME